MADSRPFAALVRDPVRAVVLMGVPVCQQ